MGLLSSLATQPRLWLFLCWIISMVVLLGAALSRVVAKIRGTEPNVSDDTINAISAISFALVVGSVYFHAQRTPWGGIVLTALAATSVGLALFCAGYLILQSDASDSSEPVPADEGWESDPPNTVETVAESGGVDSETKSGELSIINAYTTALAGIVAAVAIAGHVRPAVGIGAGSVVGGFLLVIGRRSRKRYALAGTLFALGLGGALLVLDVPEPYTQTPAVSLVGFGLVSLAIVTLRGTGRVLTQRLARRAGGEQAAGVIWDAISAVLGLLGMVWAVLTAKEKALRFGGVSSGGTISLALNVFGVEIPIPVWFLKDGLDANMVVFVGCVLIGWHTLATMHSWKRTLKMLWKFTPLYLQYRAIKWGYQRVTRTSN